MAGRNYWRFVAATILFCAVMKIPSLRFPHNEPDEVIYWQLTEQWLSTGDYSLREAAILPRLSPEMYDRPLFHHPPFFSALLVPFVFLGSPASAVMVPWIGHLLCILAVAILIRPRRAEQNDPASLLCGLALIGVATDPLLTFVSRKLWIDSIVAGLSALSIALACSVSESKRPGRMAGVAGLFLGLAGLSKLAALVIFPVALFAILRNRPQNIKRLHLIAAFGFPVAILVVPWLLWFKSATGSFLPSWALPDSFSVATNPFIREVVSRPWTYYFIRTAAIAPIALVVAWGVWRQRIPLLWIGTIFVAFTILGVSGLGFQMRHIAFAFPAFYVALASVQSNTVRALATFAIVYGTMTSGFYLVAPEFDEISTLFELVGFFQ